MALRHERDARPPVSVARRFYQGVEDCPRAFVIFYRTFRVPLHCQDKVIGRRSLQRLDDSILRTSGHDMEAVADFFC